MLQATIGLALVFGRRVRVALALAVIWSAVIWFIGEGLGMLPTGFAMALFGAPGPAAVYGILAVLAWPTSGQTSVDDVAERPWATCWSVYWLGAAALQLPFVYSASQVIHAGFEESPSAHLALLARASNAVAHVALGNPVVFSTVLGLVEVTIALGWMLDHRHPGRWLGLGIGVSVAFWVVGQGLGGVLNWGATDPGTGPLIILLALVAWPRNATAALATPASDARVHHVRSLVRTE
jgi:hypothetical protein